MRRPQTEKRSSKRPVRQYIADTHHDRKSFAEMKVTRRAPAKTTPAVPRGKT
jgi:hypothetical protein